MPVELPFDPNLVPQLLKEGRMKVVTSPSVVVTPGERPIQTDQMVERAKDILGKDFLGVEAVRTMQNTIRAIDIDGKKPFANLEFQLDQLSTFPYTEQDLLLAKQNGEMVVLRAESMYTGNIGSFNSSGITVSSGIELISIINFRELFRKDPVGSLSTVFYSFKSGANDWYKSQDFATKPGEIQLGWSIVKKELLNGSTSKNWQNQEALLKVYATDLSKKGAQNTQVRRRTATEAVWDELLYYTNNKEQLLPAVVDWTSSRASDGDLVYVGNFDSDGLRVDHWGPDGARSRLGVVPSR